MASEFQIVRRLHAVLAVDEELDVVHRTGAIKRVDSDDVAEAVRLQLAQRLAHARTFELEHAASIAPCNQLVSRDVIERQMREVDGLPGLCHKRARFLQRR